MVDSFKLPSHGHREYRTKWNRLHASTESFLLDINKENVEKVLDLVRPQLEADGGGVSLMGIDDHEIKLRFDGACKACPYRLGTVSSVIESTLVKFLKAQEGKQITVKLVDGSDD
ncbi:hypothetical protein BgAZ_201590 [Babesia gibsoni]|uniref:NIF system FeS cluster assembly NifU C-terminal domain-containing protein n=1 Tax=Babesia gibsoni TaxID=33632 RepID=A0AAD8PDD1_BABGI|nr:hypothetical protein BgAZ_201590 [Babesia gibsoni]